MTSQLYCQGAAPHTEQSHLMAESCKTGVRQRCTDALREPQTVRLTVADVPDIRISIILFSTLFLFVKVSTIVLLGTGPDTLPG